MILSGHILDAAPQGIRIFSHTCPITFFLQTEVSAVWGALLASNPLDVAPPGCLQEMRHNISEELERCEEELDREERYGGRRRSETAEFRETLAGYKYVAAFLYYTPLYTRLYIPLHTPIYSCPYTPL